MPKQNLELNNFTAGLITEATPLTYPENSCKDILNFEIQLDGSIKKRGGLRDIGGTSNIEASSWRNYRTAYYGKLGNDIAASQVTSAAVLLVKADYPNPFSAGTATHTYTTTITSNIVSVLDGFAFMTPEGVVYTTYGGGAFGTTRPILVRDQWGVDDGLGDTERPDVLGVSHRYNLYNQGWPHKAAGSGQVAIDTYAKVFDVFGSLDISPTTKLFPSNSDLYSLSTDTTQNPPIFTAAFATTNNTFNRPAPRGKFIIDALDRGKSRGDNYTDYSGLVFASIGAEKYTGNWTQIATYSGRMWYGGQSDEGTGLDELSQTLSQTLFFSQVVDSPDKLNKCYQQNDPTDPDAPDLLPTDGGVLELPGIGAIEKMVTMETGLLVMGTQKIVYITGPDGVFRADDFSVDVVSNIGVEDATTIVTTGDRVFFGTQKGLYVVTIAPESGKPMVQNISKPTIDKKWKDLRNSTTAIDCAYDKDNNKVKWMFFNAIADKNIELILDLNLNSFYLYELPSDLHGGYYVCATGLGFDGVYYTGYKTGVPFSTTYFLKEDAVDDIVEDTTSTYKSYLLTGTAHFGDTQRDKWLPYITSHFRRTEGTFGDVGGGSLVPAWESKCTLQARWNFADSPAGGKFGTPQQAYRYTRAYIPTGAGDPFDWGEEVISTKLKVRGSGKALELYYESPEDYFCHLYGWGLSVYATNAT